MTSRPGTVVAVLHDGYFGAGTGAGHSNRAFLDVTATLLAPGVRLAVLPVELGPPSPEYDPAWHAAARTVIHEAGGEVIPVGNGTAGMTRFGGLPQFREACSSAAAVVTALLPDAGRLLVTAFDAPFFGMAPRLPQAARPALVSVVRSAADWHAPDDTARARWEHDGLRATVAGGGRLAAISQAVRTHLTTELGIPGSAVVDLANGLTASERHPSPDLPAASRLLPPAAAGGFLLAYGRAAPYKGFDDLLDALAILQGRGVPLPHTVLAAVTEDPQPSQYQQHLARRISAGQLDVTLLTAYSPAVRSLLSHPHLAGIVVPSRAEPAGRIPLEAFAAGASPVIATSAGGLAETVTEGQTGYSARPADPASLARALHRALAAPPAEHARLLQAGRRMLADRYDYTANVSAFLARAAPWALRTCQSA